MKVLIVEDEPEGLARMLRLLKQLQMDIEVVGTTGTIEDTVSWLEINQPDLILMDIELSDGQCFAIFEEINVQSPIVFTTSYDEYSLQAFKVNSIDYLLKPIKLEDLRSAIQKYQSYQGYFVKQSDLMLKLASSMSAENTFRDRFLVKQGHKYKSVLTEEIAYFYVDERVTFCKVFSGQRYIMDYNLEELSSMLDETIFRRINRSYLVNLKSIVAVQNYFNGKLIVELSPSNDKEVIVSRDAAMDFKIWLGK